MKRLRNEKGAITMITLITILFMVSFLMTSYMLIANKVKTQKEMLAETQVIYEPKSTMEEIYNSYFTSDNIIPIYTVEQLLSIGNDEKININGKIYTFGNNENTVYLLKNDLGFSSIDLGLESDWVPPYENTDFVANFEWSGHTIEVTTLSGAVITYDGTYLVTITGYPPTNLTNSVRSNLVDYKIYGNSVQDGETSTVQIQNVGDLVTNESDDNYGKYKIPIKVSNGTNERTTNIYLDEPLRKVGDYADYIDFENQKIYRNVEVLDNTGTLTIEESYQGTASAIETEIELPDIQLYKGTNTITVETTIQPSNMSVTYNAKQ